MFPLIIYLTTTTLFFNSVVNCQQQAQQQQAQQQQQLQQIQQTSQYVQHNNILYFDVFEGSPNNTYVGNIKSSDGQTPYLIVPWAPTPEKERIQAFRVDLLNGDLYTNSVLDREHRELYHFIAIVKDPFWEIKCTVTIKDINDNAPMFLINNLPPMPFGAGGALSSSTASNNYLINNNNETNYVIELPEGQRGVRKVLPLAIDLDSPQYGIKEFRIVSGNTPSGTFQLVEHEAPARSSLSASLAQAGLPALDDPSSSISAVDNPRIQEQLNAQAVVLIPSQPQAQLPQQQSSPASSSSSTSSSPSSSSSSSSTQQQQQQQQLQQQLQQQFNNQNSNNFQSPSSSSANLNSPQQQAQSTSGSIMQPASALLHQQHQPQSSRYFIDVEVSQYLDRENQSSYQLVVEAIDGGQPPLIGRLLVTVNVQDANDNDPIFTKKVYECFVLENANKNTPLLRVQAFDADIDLNGQISYSIKRPAPSGNSTSFSATAIANNNSTGGQQQQQRARSAQQASPAQSSSSSNNNNQNNNNPNGIRSFSSLQQQQQSASAELFDIDPIKGEIYSINSLDYEQDQMHEFWVEARDHGKPSRSSMALVKVFVNDVNDDPPQQLAAAASSSHFGPSSKGGSATNNSSSNTNGKSPNGSSPASKQIPPQALNGDYITKQFDEFSARTSSIEAFINTTGDWLSQLPAIGVFLIVFILFAFLFAVPCFYRIRSSRESIETDHYNDTAGLTLSPNGDQLKQSPNHSLSNHHHTPPDHHHNHHNHHHIRTDHHHSTPEHQHQHHNHHHIRPDHHHTPSDHHHTLSDHHHARPDHHHTHSYHHHTLPDHHHTRPDHHHTRPDLHHTLPDHHRTRLDHSHTALDLHHNHHRRGGLPATPNSTFNSQSLTHPHTWLIGLTSAQDCCGSYDWDYLVDWKPQYQTLMELLGGQPEGRSLQQPQFPCWFVVRKNR